MADSNITKLVLSNALKELLAERPFEKISVSDICQKFGFSFGTPVCFCPLRRGRCFLIFISES